MPVDVNPTDKLKAEITKLKAENEQLAVKVKKLKKKEKSSKLGKRDVDDMKSKLDAELLRLGGGGGVRPEKSGGDTVEIAEAILMLKVVGILEKDFSAKGLAEAVDYAIQC